MTSAVCVSAKVNSLLARGCGLYAKIKLAPILFQKVLNYPPQLFTTSDEEELTPMTPRVGVTRRIVGGPTKTVLRSVAI